MTSLSLSSHPKGYSITCREALTFVVRSPYADRHLELSKTGSLANRAFHFCLGGLEKVPGVCAGVSILERVVVGAYDSCTCERRVREMRHETIKKFWKEHIQSFKISHGTSSIHHKHFREHGISATYPVALGTMIEKIRKVWTNHEKDIFPKTDYFRLFEERYDLAQKEKQVAISFSANPSITDEFTRGARGSGGEWIRELRSFLREADEKKELLQTQEKEVVAEMQALIEVMAIVPPMVVKVSAACPELYFYFGQRRSPFLPLRNFIAYVEANTESLLIGDILHFLNTTVLPNVEKEGRRLQERYEISIERNIPQSELELEILTREYHFPREKLTERHKQWLKTLDCDSLV